MNVSFIHNISEVINAYKLGSEFATALLDNYANGLGYTDFEEYMEAKNPKWKMIKHPEKYIDEDTFYEEFDLMFGDFPDYINFYDEESYNFYAERLSEDTILVFMPNYDDEAVEILHKWINPETRDTYFEYFSNHTHKGISQYGIQVWYKVGSTYSYDVYGYKPSKITKRRL